MRRYRVLFVDGFKEACRWSTLVGAMLIGIAAAVLSLPVSGILLALAALLYGACYCADRSG